MNGFGCGLKGSQLESSTRYFTVTEANRALVLVRRVVADVVSFYRRMLDLQESLETADLTATHDRQLIRNQLVGTAGRMQAFLGELDEIGVEVMDWESGVVHFPCLLDGREVALCWRLDEPAVSHWVEIGGDFSARIPIDSRQTVGSS